MIGHQVLTSGNNLAMNGSPVAAGVQLGGSASGVTVQILSATGAVVRTLQLGPQQSGIVPFQWDGLTDSGAQAARARSCRAAMAACSRAKPSCRAQVGQSTFSVRRNSRSMTKTVRAGFQRYFARSGPSSLRAAAGQNFFSVRMAFFSAEWHGQVGASGILGIVRTTICWAAAALRGGV